MKCLEKDRTRRYETANGLAMEIRRYLNHEPVHAGPPTTRYRLRKFVRRNRGAVVAGGVVAASIMAGLASTTWGVFWALGERDRARQAESWQILERQRAEKALAREAKQRGIAVEQERRARDEAARADTEAAEAKKQAQAADAARNDAESEKYLLRAAPVLRTAQGAPGRYRICMEAAVKLYEKWNVAEPNKGYDAKSTEWRTKLAEYKATTQPTASRPVSTRPASSREAGHSTDR